MFAKMFNIQLLTLFATISRQKDGRLNNKTMATQAELEKKLQEVEDYATDLEFDLTNKMHNVMCMVEELIKQNQMLTEILTKHQTMFEEIQRPRLN